MKNLVIERRTFLRGLGTAVALPFLDAMQPLAAIAAPAGKVRPNRMAFISVPNGVHMDAWRPVQEGTVFDLPSILEPLQPVRGSVSVLTGLTHDKARPNGDGPGDHARSAGAFLTGCQPRKTAGADIKLGISADQYAALKVGSRTRFPSLELGCEANRQAGNCDSGYSCAYSSTISWRSENTPVAKEIDPRQLFERLFGSGTPEENFESRDRRDKYNQSILDFVLEDASKLKARMGAHDQRKLDEYLTSVREIEQRIALAGKGGVPDAGAKPAGIPSDYGEHLRLMFDMLALAFQADLTRISTFMLANEGSNRNYAAIGIGEGHHELSHHQRNAEKQDKLRKINRFHMTHFAQFLTKLQSMKEGDSTVLDNSMIVYGSGISDGDRHNHDDLPVVIAGRGAGTIKSSRHIVYPRNTPMANLFVSMLDRVGIPAETLGDSTGRITQLF